jgi:zinc transport system substrate-binding protein
VRGGRRTLVGSGGLAVAVLLLVACGSSAPETSGIATGGGRLQIVATFYPLAWLAEQIGGDDVNVTNLTPPGVEPHDLELAPDQVETLTDADLAVVMGHDFQPALESIARARSRPTVTVLDVPTAAGERDPHVWLDPVQFSMLRQPLVVALSKLRPGRAAEFERRSSVVGAELSGLDAEFRDGLRACDRREVVTSHAAFGRLAARYGLTQHPIAGLAPDAEPDPDRLDELASLVRDKGVTTIFTEALASKEFAETLARETGARTEVLSPIEGLTAAQLSSGSSYLTEMRTGLRTLERVLGCRPGSAK